MNQRSLDLLSLVTGSIVNNLESLYGQIVDYNLTMTEEDFKELNRIEEELHALVKKITE